MYDQYNVRKYKFLDVFSTKTFRTIVVVLLFVPMAALIFGLVVGRGGCVSQVKSIKATEKQGYRNVTVTERHNFFPGWHGCDDKDAAAFEARAVNPAGQEVDIIICAGWPFKGVTVRTK